MAKSKKNSFSLHPPTGTWVHFLSLLHELENICLWQEEQCWSGLVFLASCSHWYCAAVFNSAVFFCFPPPTTMSFLLCYLYSFLIKVLWKKKALARSYSTCAWTYGWKTLCAQHCDDISWCRKAANVFVTSCSPAFPPPRWGERGLQFYFMQFKCHLRPYIQYSCLVTNLWRQRKHWSAPYFLTYGLNDCLQASHYL